MSLLYVVSLISFFIGVVVGSFLNVCIYRIPAGKSVVSPRSCCPFCSNSLRWYHNIPVVSWVMLAGRCAYCRESISIRYPLIESLNALLYVGIFFFYGLSPALAVYWLFVSILVVIAFIDLDHQIIPDVISLPGIFCGFLGSFFISWVGWVDSLLGILLGGGVLLAIAWGYQFLAKREGMGGGDIKLLAMIGAFLGWKAVFPVIFIASLIGSLVGLPLMLIRKTGGQLAIPFGPFLALAATIYLLWGPLIIGWYLSVFR